MYQAIFIDIDGTLRNDARELKDRTIKAIQKTIDLGILIIICSGRPVDYTINISKEAKASRYIISSNGAQGYDYVSNETIFYNPIHPDTCLKLYQMAKEKDVKFVMNTKTGRVVTRQMPEEKDTLLEEPIEEFLKKNAVVQCLFQDTDFHKVKSLEKYIKKIEGVEIKNQSKCLVNPQIKPEGNIYYDIADNLTSKGYGIKTLCKKLKIDLKQIISIGDNYNDIAMFQVAGYSVAMDNANEEVKQYADETTLSNNEEGVAVFLEKLIKNKGEILC